MRDWQAKRNLVRNIFLLLLSVALFVTGGWGVSQYNQKVLAQALLENVYQQSFYNLMTNVDNMVMLTGKARVAATPLQGSDLLTQIKNESQKAEENISNLPFEQTMLLSTGQYFNQLSDYAASLAKVLNRGESLSQEEKESLDKIYLQVKEIFSQLQSLEAETAKGDLYFSAQPKSVLQEVSAVVAGSNGSGDRVALDYFQELNGSLGKIESLKYDGKFSSHMENLPAKGLTDGEDTGEEKARELADSFVALLKADAYEYVSHNLINEKASIPAYLFEYRNGENSVYLSISKAGGQVINFFSSRRPDESKMPTEELRQRADTFLESAGYDHLEIVGEKNENNCFHITYARREGEVLCYPDKIMVSLAMDNGDIITLDAQAYWMNHCERKSSAAKVKLEDAQGSLQDGFEASSNQLALICDGAGGETLCYEFRGMVGDDEYSVYINTEDGSEECILNNCQDKDGSFYSK